MKPKRGEIYIKTEGTKDLVLYVLSNVYCPVGASKANHVDINFLYLYPRRYSVGLPFPMEIDAKIWKEFKKEEDPEFRKIIENLLFMDGL